LFYSFIKHCWHIHIKGDYGHNFCEKKANKNMIPILKEFILRESKLTSQSHSEIQIEMWTLHTQSRKRELRWQYAAAAAAAAKSLQSCPTLCDSIDGSPPDSPVPGILQARTLEWVAISFSNAWKWKVKVKSFSRVRLLATPWTAPTRLLCPWDFSSLGLVIWRWQPYWSSCSYMKCP